MNKIMVLVLALALLPLANAALDDKLLVYYSGDGNAEDSGLLGNDLDATGAAHLNSTAAACLLGTGCFEVGGNSDPANYYVTHSSVPQLDFFSVCAWGYPRTGLDNAIFIYSETADGLYGYIDFDYIGTPNKWDGRYYDGSAFNALDTTSRALDNWYYVCWTHNTTGHLNLYVNAAKVATNAGGIGKILTLRKWRLGSDGGDEFLGRIDEMGIWNRSLTSEEVTALYNGGTGLNPIGELPAAPAAVLTSFVKNGSRVTKTLLNKGEFFRVFSNFSLDNGSVLSGAICNVTLYNASRQIIGNPSFSLCNSGCDFSTYKNQTMQESNVSVIFDAVHFRACHYNSNPTNSLTGFICNKPFTVSSGSFPVCPATALVYINSTGCLGKEYVQYNLTTNAVISKRVLVTEIAADRRYSVFTQGMFFNSTNGLYRSNRRGNYFVYYIHGLKSIKTNCTEGPYNKFRTDQVTVENDPPLITFDTVENSRGVFVLADRMAINFSSGNWNWHTSVVDFDMSMVQYRFRNSTGQVIWSNNTVVPVNPLVTDGFLFAKNQQYNFSVFANDSHHNSSYKSIKFFINDTTLPVCSGLNSVTLFNGSTYSWAVSCSDDYFWSFNLSCGNGFNHFKGSIANTTYSFANSTLISSGTDFSCAYEYCDGHTAMLIEPMDIKPIGKEGIIDVEGIQLNVREQVNAVRLNKELDRYSFCYDFADAKQAYATVPIPEGCFPAPNSKWKGHLVCPEQHIWIDFENPDVKVSIADDEVVLDMAEAKDKANVCFDSIGKWNCVSGSQAFTVLIPEKNSSSMFKIGYCPDTEPGALIIGIVIFFLFGILVLGVSLRIPVFAYAAGLGLIVASFTMAGCSAFIGVCFLVIGLISILAGTQV